MKYHDLKTCSPKCRSTQHANELAGLISKTNNTEVLLSGLWQCWNCQKVQDPSGRHILHLASMFGRSELCNWLVRLRKADVNVKTLENGWTPAHCACFYGQLDALLVLIRLGANLAKNDIDRLTPIETLALDKWLETRLEPDTFEEELEVYSWGSNVNFTLANHVQKSNAEMVEHFVKSGVFVREISINKFHSVFLTTRGQVYTCGVGMNGRLGLGSEQTFMIPKHVEALKDVNVVQVATSRNNTYFLAADGWVFSCGSNEFKQLGHVDLPQEHTSLVPKRISFTKKLKGKKIVQMACSRFHCVLLTSTSEVYCFGLNAGQMGLPNELISGNSTSSNTYNATICYITEPRLITTLNDPDVTISQVACSDGCTVCLQTSKHLLHVLNDFKPRRLYYLKETGSQFIKIRVLGGRLDRATTNIVKSNTNCEDLKWIEDLHDPIIIVGLTEKNLIFMWREYDPTWRCLNWAGGKHLSIVDFDLNVYGLIVATNLGLCYKASFKEAKPTLQKTSQVTNSATSLSSATPAFGSAPIILNTETLEVERIPLVNRCSRVFCDMKGRNFFSLQYQPTVNMRYHPEKMKSSFRENMSDFYDDTVLMQREDDFDEFTDSLNFHDVALLYKGHRFNAHKFILTSRGFKLFNKLNLDKERVIDMNAVLDEKFSLESFEILLRYLYGCQIDREFLVAQLERLKISSESAFNKFLVVFKETLIEKFGFNELKPNFDAKYISNKLQVAKLDSRSVDEKLKILADCLLDGLAQSRKPVTFNRNSYVSFQDCQIICNSSQEIKCHKCILVARSEFFRNMFMGGWLESNMSSIKLPFDADLMQIFVDYLYTDELKLDSVVENSLNVESSAKSRMEKEIELSMNMYVLSDQLLIVRLKNLCEFKLAYLANLKNVVELLDFAHKYSAQQLKEYCIELCIRNLVSLIDSKVLENLNDDVLAELSTFYKSYFRLIDGRRLTPYSHGLDPSKVDLVPLDLLYDEKFLSTTIDDSIAVAGKKKTINQLDENKSPPKNVEIESEIKDDSLDISAENEVEKEPVKEEDSIKWKKVKKKKKKTSESNDKVNINEAQNKSTEIQLNTKSIEEPITSVNKKPERQESQVIADYNNVEWPDLSNSAKKSPSPQDQHSKQEPKKYVKTTKITSSAAPIASNVKANSVEKSSSPWGNLSSMKSSTSNSTSLRDVIDEEIKKSNNLKSVRKQVVIEPKPSHHESPITSSKTWNFNPEMSNLSGSFAKILEMENKSEKIYSNQKKRLLNSIQIEERAIQELKQNYDVENITNMTITIELVEDTPNVAPIWKKNF